jgi:hypothetical protein
LGDIQQPAANKFERIERFALEFSICAAPIAKHDAPGLVITHQPAFAERRLTGSMLGDAAQAASFNEAMQ